MKHEHAYILVIAFVALTGLVFLTQQKQAVEYVGYAHLANPTVADCILGDHTKAECETCCQTATNLPAVTQTQRNRLLYLDAVIPTIPTVIITLNTEKTTLESKTTRTPDEENRLLFLQAVLPTIPTVQTILTTEQTNLGNKINTWDGCATPCANIVEVCNGRDDNSDGNIDEGLPTHTKFTDADGDGFGDKDIASVTDCFPLQAAHAAVGEDCNDANAAINPGATDALGDGVDNNCDGNVDEGVTCRVPIHDILKAYSATNPSASKGTYTTDITTTNAQAKCLSLEIFGKETQPSTTPKTYEPFQVPATTTVHARIIDTATVKGDGQNALLECKLPCTTGLSTVERCKDVVHITGTNPNAQSEWIFYTIPTSTPKCTK